MCLRFRAFPHFLSHTAACFLMGRAIVTKLDINMGFTTLPSFPHEMFTALVRGVTIEPFYFPSMRGAAAVHPGALSK